MNSILHILGFTVICFSTENAGNINNEFFDVYTLRYDVNLKDIVMQESEVQDVRWIDYEDFKDQIKNSPGSFVEHKYAYELLFVILDQ